MNNFQGDEAQGYWCKSGLLVNPHKQVGKCVDISVQTCCWLMDRLKHLCCVFYCTSFCCHLASVLKLSQCTFTPFQGNLLANSFSDNSTPKNSFSEIFLNKFLCWSVWPISLWGDSSLCLGSELVMQVLFYLCIIALRVAHHRYERCTVATNGVLRHLHLQ